MEDTRIVMKDKGCNTQAWRLKYGLFNWIFVKFGGTCPTFWHASVRVIRETTALLLFQWLFLYIS